MPPENGQMFFMEVTFNSKKQYFGHKTSAFSYSEEKGELGRIRHTKDRSVIGLEVIKSHVFGDLAFKTVEIILFKATLSKIARQQNRNHELHQTKVAISVEKDVPFDFDFGDELESFRFPYVYFLHQNFIKIVSPITNLIVKVIDFAPSLKQRLQEHKLVQKVKQMVTPKLYDHGVFSLYTNISVPHYMECYLSSPQLDCCLFFRLLDNNDQQMKLRIADKSMEIAEMWGPPK